MADDGDNTAEEVRDNIVSGWTPDHVRYLDHSLPGETPNALDDFFTADSSADYTEVAASGTGVWTYGTQGVLSVKFTNQSNLDWAAALKSLGGLSAPVTIETHISLAAQPLDFLAAGIGFSAGVLTSSRWEGVVVGHSSGLKIGYTDTSSGTITNMDWASHSAISTLNGGLFIRYVWETTNTFSWNISPNGAVWTAMGDADQSKTLAPTHFGPFVTTYTNAAPSVASYDYLRVYEADLSTT